MDIKRKLNDLLTYHERATQILSMSRRPAALTRTAQRWIAKRNVVLEEIVEEYEKLEIAAGEKE